MEMTYKTTTNWTKYPNTNSKFMDFVIGQTEYLQSEQTKGNTDRKIFTDHCLAQNFKLIHAMNSDVIGSIDVEGTVTTFWIDEATANSYKNFLIGLCEQCGAEQTTTISTI